MKLGYGLRVIRQVKFNLYKEREAELERIEAYQLDAAREQRDAMIQVRINRL
eukprot:SAG11_NODE_8867_length_968_cov_1.284235_3_plen_51_part_01